MVIFHKVRHWTPKKSPISTLDGAAQGQKTFELKCVMPAGPCEPTPLAEAPRRAESFERKKERPPKAALQVA